MRAKFYTIAITRFILSLVGYLPLFFIAWPLIILGYLGEIYQTAHAAFVTSTKQLLQANDQQFNKTE